VTVIRTKEQAPEAPADELARLELRAQADERALASLRDDLHNATVAAAQAGGEHLAPALQSQRDLQRELDITLESAVPVLARLAVLRQQVALDRRAAQVAKLRVAGERFTATAGPCETAFTDAFTKLKALTEAARAVSEVGRGCGPDVLRDVTDGIQLARLKSWLLTGLDDAGLHGTSPAVMQYDPHQITPGVPPTEAAADLTVRLETTR
jgi:hypothetical protein